MAIKTVLALFLSLLASVCASGQNMHSYTVQRGESMEAIAAMFNVSIDELKQANLDMEEFYTGLEISVPIGETTLNAAPQNALDASMKEFDAFMNKYTEYLQECVDAENLLKAGDYKKAQKRYQQILSKYQNDFVCDHAMYGNALCSYNQGKWKNAIKELSAVADNAECHNSHREHCRELLKKAQKKRQQQLDKRANLWGNILLSAAAVGTAVAAASAQNKTSSYSNSGYNYQSISAHNKSVDEIMIEADAYAKKGVAEMQFNYDMMRVSANEFGKRAVAEIEFNMKQEEIAVKQNFIKNYRSIYGKDPSDQEIFDNYNNYVAMKANSIRASQQASSGLIDDKSNDGASSSSSRRTEKYCHVCKGDGKCIACHGSGYSTDNAFGTGVNYSKKCSVCGGHKVCNICHGEGEIYK